MDKVSILNILKVDLEIATTSRDEYLNNVIDLAEAAITKEGITLKNNTEDGMLVENYAAFLYRKKKGDDTSMPRHLRYLLNNRLISEKAGTQ